MFVPGADVVVFSVWLVCGTAPPTREREENDGGRQETFDTWMGRETPTMMRAWKSHGSQTYPRELSVRKGETETPRLCFERTDLPPLLVDKDGEVLKDFIRLADGVLNGLDALVALLDDRLPVFQLVVDQGLLLLLLLPLAVYYRVWNTHEHETEREHVRARQAS